MALCKGNEGVRTPCEAYLCRPGSMFRELLSMRRGALTRSSANYIFTARFQNNVRVRFALLEQNGIEIFSIMSADEAPKAKAPWVPVPGKIDKLIDMFGGDGDSDDDQKYVYRSNFFLRAGAIDLHAVRPYLATRLALCARTVGACSVAVYTVTRVRHVCVLMHPMRLRRCGLPVKLFTPHSRGQDTVPLTLVHKRGTAVKFGLTMSRLGHASMCTSGGCRRRSAAATLRQGRPWLLLVRVKRLGVRRAGTNMFNGLFLAGTLVAILTSALCTHLLYQGRRKTRRKMHLLTKEVSKSSPGKRLVRSMKSLFDRLIVLVANRCPRTCDIYI